MIGKVWWACICYFTITLDDVLECRGSTKTLLSHYRELISIGSFVDPKVASWEQSRFFFFVFLNVFDLC